jgi:hypothetical protein
MDTSWPRLFWWVVFIVREPLAGFFASVRSCGKYHGAPGAAMRDDEV